MSKYSYFSNNNLSSGFYVGRVLDLINNKGNLENNSSKKTREMLILIADQIYPIKINNELEISVGSIISFNVNSNFFVENIIIEQIPLNINVNGDFFRWRKPSKTPSRMQLIEMRNKLIFGVREWFYKKKFIETETPFHVRAPSPEPQTLSVKTDSGFLITSPEFQMKRLLVGGFEKIFQIARCFRRGEVGTQHNPEFTMLEWYRSGEKLEVLENDIEQLVMYLSKKVDRENFNHIPLPPWPRVKLVDLFKEHLGIILDGSETAKNLIEKTKESGNSDLLFNIKNNLGLSNTIDYELIFSQLWNKIQENICKRTPLFVYEWPQNLPSLARTICGERGFVDRVEFFANGMELANGYGELTDSIEQRSRFENDLKNRKIMGLDSVPLDEKFLSSLQEGMPKSSGMALGLDRLIMWICSIENIRDVLCFNNDEL